ncbi:MAG: aminotransferase class V-fold PLP-dependent enzyme [Candidatus Zixiibacteriota bacterium]
MLGTTELRAQFPHTTERTYFNVASNGPMPNRAYEVLNGSLSTSRHAMIGAQENVFESLTSISANGARIFGCSPDEVGFGFNTTFGINLAAFGLPLEAGDEVLLSDVDFPTNVYPWLELRNRGINVKFIKSINRCFSIDELRKAITKNTKCLSVSFVQFFNGYKSDLKAIGEICKANGMYFVVDAIQGAGVEPLRLNEWGVDIASAGAQKWLLSSQGTGLYFISKEMQSVIRPPWRSWLSIDWKCDWTNLNDYGRAYPKTARQFELGTYPVPIMLGMDESIKFLTEIGTENIQAHNHALLDRLITYLESNPAYTITSDLTPAARSGILTFTTTSGDIRSVFTHLQKMKIMIALREGSIRVSVHVFNNFDDIARLIEGLESAALS